MIEKTIMEVKSIVVTGGNQSVSRSPPVWSAGVLQALRESVITSNGNPREHFAFVQKSGETKRNETQGLL